MTWENVKIRVLISKSAELDVLRLISIPKTQQSIFRYGMFPEKRDASNGLERDI